ncbi:MAG: class I SAM-dependent methyltransferase [Nautiliaceae bacterium]
MKPSKYHKNKSSHNWLIYMALDRHLIKYSKYIKGILVDLGCGEKPYKEFFLKYCNKYIGVDWENSLHNVKPDVISDLNQKIDLPDEYADTAVAISVMEHLYNPQKFLNEVYRILKRNSYFILQVPWQWWVHEAPYDYFRYTPYGLKYLLENAGFKIIEISPQGGLFSTLVLKFNYFTLRLIRGPKFLKLLIKLSLIPMWNLSQCLAILLDKLDKHWILEAPGYFVLAIKK